MRILFICMCVVMLHSCTTPASDQKLDDLNKRMELLEQKIESLERGGPLSQTNGNSVMGTGVANGSCQGITKKGKPCKRKAKANGYCWQHGA